MFDFTVSGTLEIRDVPIPRLAIRTKPWQDLTAIRENIPVWICSEAEIQRLNTRFRSTDGITDVLSWPYSTDTDEAFGSCPGEIAVCWSVCKSQSATNGWDTETEMIRLLAHGVAHIMGYEHPTPQQEIPMIEFEEKLLRLANCPPLYSSPPRKFTERLMISKLPRNQHDSGP